MKRLIGFSVILAVLLSVMPAAPARASDLQPPDSSYRSLFFNFNSNLCLQPWYEAPINGLTIVQQPCNHDNLYQNWSFDILRKDLWTYFWGKYLIRNRGSGQCLDDRDGRTANGSPVQQWPCNYTSTTMQWKMETVGLEGVGWESINERTGKCLDVRGGSSAPGAVLQIYQCTSNPPSYRNWAQVFMWTDTTR